MNTVLERIESVRSVFLETQMFCAQHGMIEILAYLENREPEFRSIGYESASMTIALKELQDHATKPQLTEWLSFAEDLSSKHSAQLYIGLGWAIAKLDIPFTMVASTLDPRFHHRIADGCGYYDGSFRQRQTILGLQVPQYLPSSALPIYYQGVGRSLWYSCAADIEKVQKKIAGFPLEFQPDLWRGLGIAVAYVGGSDDRQLNEILEKSGSNGIQLTCGAALAAGSRLAADSMTPGTDRCARTWFRRQAPEDLNIFSATIIDIDHTNEEVYQQWTVQIEKGLAASFQEVI